MNIPSGSASLLLLAAAVLLLSTTTTTSAFNITHLLEQYPDFSQFNNLLFQTRLSAEINRRRTITVLALSNDRVGDLAGKPLDLVRRILSTHVVLDYYDLTKLNKLKGNSTVLTTLYQATGIADDRQGFLRVAHRPDGIFFGSAVSGSPVDVGLAGAVAAQPYNISVLSLNSVIVTPGFDGTVMPVATPPPPPAAVAPAPETDAEAPVAADAEAPVADEEPTGAAAEAPASASAEAPGSEAAPDDEEAGAADEPPLSLPNSAAACGVSIGLIVGSLVSFV